MKRFWISWYSKLEPENIPFKAWITGETMDEPPAFTYVADVQAESQEAAFTNIAELFPDYKERFCSEVAEDWQPSDRFQ